MTKLKNTKKGMAKKALSISLVAAMLATSNVPVWAAEDLFSDGSAAVEAPVVEEPAAEVDVFSAEPAEEETPAASTFAATEGYTVNTNMELKANDWNTDLVFGLKDGVTDAAKFEILDKNSLPVSATKVEVYGGLGMISAVDVTNGDVAAALAKVKVGKESFLASPQVTAKVYVGENVVCELSAAVKAVDISTWNISLDTASTVYNGKIQTPTATVAESGLTADVIVRFEGATEAKNVGTYSCYAEGIGAFTGITTKKATYKITAATVNEKNLSVTLSGDITYNGTKSLPEVEVKDLITGEVLPAELYTVKVTNTKVGTYTNSNVTITLKSNATVDGTKVTNNFAQGDINRKCITGTYKVSALNLNNLSDKYDITVNAREAANIGWNDLIIVDKSTGKTVKATDVLPTGELTLKSALNSETKVATATITPKTSTNNITGSYSFDYSVVSNVMDKGDVSFPKGTVIGTTTLNAKKSLQDVDATITNSLSKIYYTGSAIEPLKDAFSNMVLTTTVGTTDQALVLGQDYDLVYTDNTDSKDVSEKESSIKIVFKGQYAGSIEYKFTIQKAQVTVKAIPVSYVPGKNSYDLAVEVTDNVSKTAVPESVYTVTTTKKGTSINTYAEGNVVFNNKNYNITNSSAATNDAGFMYVTGLRSKVTAKTLENCTGTVEGEYVYTGETVNPKVVVKDGDIVLTENKDYKIVSKVGVNAGPAYVIVEGMGNYTGRLTIDYTIKKANLADAIVKSDNSKDDSNYDVAYTGTLVAPNTNGGVFIGKDKLTPYDSINNTGDYIITFDEKAVDVGTYTFTITAAPSSTKVEGEFKGTYKVVPSKMSGSFATQIGLNKVPVNQPLDVELTGASYTGSEIKIDSFKTKYVVIDNKNNVLTEGKDYRLEYTNNVDAGLATVKAYGLGNHAYVDANGVEIPMATMSYYIGGKTITASMIKKINNAEYAGGLAVDPDVVVMFDEDTRLVQGKDYVVTTTVTKIGSYTGKQVTITGKGGYTTTDAKNTKLVADSSLTWSVTKKDLKNTTVTVAGKTVIVMNGTVIVPSSEYDTVFSEDGKKVTVTAKADSQYYTGSKEADVTSETVGQPIIKEVKVSGNKINVILEGEADGATGYDYVISTVNDYQNGRLPNGINRNQLVTETTYRYLDKGLYYAYCHAWTRDEEGKKVFGEWSNIVPFSISAITPEKPTITSVKKSGRNVTVTWTQCDNAEGYDVVLGTAMKKVNGELRPVEYGKAVKKLGKNTYSVTFKSCPKGATFYAGLHAWNRTSETGVKVFSEWSDSVKVTI